MFVKVTVLILLERYSSTVAIKDGSDAQDALVSNVPQLGQGRHNKGDASPEW